MALSETARVTILLSTWDDTALALQRGRQTGATGGQVPAAGSLMFQDSKDFRLVINATNEPFNFPRAILADEPENINKGTKHSKLLMVWECSQNDSGLLWNTTVS